MRVKFKIYNLKFIIFKEKFFFISFFLGLLFTLAATFFLIVNFSSLPPLVPLWYTRAWGKAQLAKPIFLWLLPSGSIIILLLNTFLAEIFLKSREKTSFYFLNFLTIFSSLFINFSLYRIISKVLIPHPPLLNLPLRPLFPPFLISFALACLSCPYTIKFAKKLNIIDDPKTHKHPAILHEKPITRGGGVPFFIGFLLASLLFLPLTKHLLGIYLGTFVAILVGLLDDKYDLNPYLRLGTQALAAAFIVGSGIGITFLRSPFGEIIRLDTVDLAFHFFGEHHILLLADIFAFLWIFWVMNMLSWSNGVDGQFSGIVSITALFIALLSLRFVSYEPLQWQTAKLAAAVAGASLGLLPFTWHPAKIFWGFGATGVGLIIATLAILSGAKVATAILVLLVPILDAIVTIGRRLLAHCSPVWGDRGHLHHRLLERGWSQQKIAVLYWLLTALCGILALVTAGKSKALTLLTLGGIFGFLLVIINLKGKRYKLKLPKLKLR